MALDGNALVERGERPESGIQERHVTELVAALAPVLHQQDMVITHGNGPQVGSLSRPHPFDVLGAQTLGVKGPSSPGGQGHSSLTACQARL